MNYLKISSLVLVLSTMCSLPVHALDADSTADIRCLVIAMKLANKPDGPSQSAGTLLASYFIGRLDGRAPRVDVEGLMAKEMAGMSQADFESETKRCGGVLTDRAKQVAQISKHLSDHSKK